MVAISDYFLNMLTTKKLKKTQHLTTNPLWNKKKPAARYSGNLQTGFHRNLKYALEHAYALNKYRVSDIDPEATSLHFHGFETKEEAF